MATSNNSIAPIKKKPYVLLFIILIVIGFGTFILGLSGEHPGRAWQAYLINFLLWSAIAQGALLFSAVMHTTKARWSGPLSNLAESFSAFFPISFILFFLLIIGKDHVFPWLHQDLHGKEGWLNLPFLISRNTLGLFILYGVGFAYLYYALQLKLKNTPPQSKFHKFMHKVWDRKNLDDQQCKNRKSAFSVLYIFAFAIILSLMGYDLVMSMEPHWHSTLFGAYTFVKAFYIGLGALIILASIFYLSQGSASGLMPSHFHDLGKLFFAFCLLWADFFYVQLVVIWYGNISEETTYIITRTMRIPWQPLAWFVFAVCFIIPFIILLNKNVKTKPLFMVILCSFIIIGIWLEHLLLVGPAMNQNVSTLPLGLTDGLITLGFFGLMALAVSYFLKLFPELVRVKEKDVT